MAVRSLRANMFRSILTLLGIVIGVGSVIAMLAIGDGAKQVVIDRISAMGSNLLLVRPGAPNQRGSWTIQTLVNDDVKAINAQVDNVLAAIPEQNTNVTVRFGGADYATQRQRHFEPLSPGAPLAGGARHLLHRGRRARLRGGGGARPDRGQCALH